MVSYISKGEMGWLYMRTCDPMVCFPPSVVEKSSIKDRHGIMCLSSFLVDFGSDSSRSFSPLKI